MFSAYVTLSIQRLCPILIVVVSIVILIIPEDMTYRQRTLLNHTYSLSLQYVNLKTACRVTFYNCIHV